jgi:NAD(P)-dependent dehydrogenase (short-subunit alcohol dehydrogenase family)
MGKSFSGEHTVEGYTLDGKTALVTGVEHRFAREAAGALAEAGADVAVLTGHAGSEHQTHAEKATEAVRQHRRQSRSFAIEVASISAVRAAIDELVQEWGHLDILVNGLDAPFAGPFLESVDGHWQRLFEHMLYGTLHCVQAAGRHMLSQRRGRILTYVSILAERGVAHCAAYGAAQAALIQVTRSLAVEWGTQGITVNAIGGGWMQHSPFLPVADADLQRLVRYIPNHRLGQPDDLAALTVYLASDLGGNVTGQVMYVEGGVMSHP